MLPDIRFAIGAVLASALLIVTAFGLAATVRIAHHKTGGPLEAPRVLAYGDPMDWGPRPDALRRLDDPRINDPLLDRLAAIPVEPAAVRPIDTAEAPVREEAGAPVVIALPIAAVPPAVETPSAAAPAAVAETPVVTAPIAVVAEIPPAQIAGVNAVETKRPSPDRITILLAAIEIAAKSDPRAAVLRVAVPAKKAAPTAKKKVAKARRASKRGVARAPTASTGYPVTGNPFGNSGFGKNTFDTNKSFGSD
jgi:hypothetical protein